MNAIHAIRNRGFTLIELIVVVTIAAILAAVAIPQYSQYVVRSKRAAAATVLLEAAGALERNFTTNGCYNKTTVAVCQSQAAGTDMAPSGSIGGLSAAPREGRASYSVRVAGFGAAGQTFTLTATPCSVAADDAACPAGSDAFADAECGNLTLTHTGARGITGTADVARCWR